MDVLGRQLATLYGQEFKPGSEYDARVFLNRTCGLRLKLSEHINDDLLKALARFISSSIQAPHMAAVGIKRIDSLRRLSTKTAAIRDGGSPVPWLGRIACVPNPLLQSLPRYVRKYLIPGPGKAFIKADYSAFPVSAVGAPHTRSCPPCPVSLG